MISCDHEKGIKYTNDMDLNIDKSLEGSYHSPRQNSRVLTEGWAEANLYCPVCGAPHLIHYPAGKPVADFYCDSCGSDFELKSTRKKFGNKIPASGYSAMMRRIKSPNSPHFLFMEHDGNQVKNLTFVPNHFFVPDIVEKRDSLSSAKRRAGWIGCMINLKPIPSYGKIPIVANSIETPQATVLGAYAMAKSLHLGTMVSRRWLVDVLQCVDKLGPTFTLKDMYSFADVLQKKHPKNKNIQAKIRQQLQLLREKGVIEFTSRGHYKKI